MNYLPKNNVLFSNRNSTRARSGRWIFVFGIGIFVFLFLLRTFFSPFFSSLIYKMAYPFWQVRGAAAVQSQDLSLGVTSKSTLENQIQSLEDENYSLKASNIELTAELAGFSNTTLAATIASKRQGVLAKVVSRPPYAPFDTFVLDEGQTSGITEGGDAYVGDNIFIGTVTESEKDHSTVTLFSSGLSTTQAVVLRTGEPVSLHGSGGGNFEMTLPKDFD